MKDADRAIGKVLAGMGGVEASAGLERRVAAGLERRMAGRRVASSLGWLWVGGCCAAMLVVAVGMSVRQAERRDAIAPKVARRESGGQVRRDGVAEVQEGVSQRLKPSSVVRGSGTAEAVPLSKPALVSSASRVEGGRSDAVSFPAPPMPLTQQERLLLRVADHSGPEEVAMLDPVARAMQDAEETAVFLEFFGRPLSVEQTIKKINQGESR